MITRHALSQQPELCRARALGCLIGLAVGDALGDLGRDQATRQRYGIVTNLYAAAGSTDDTEFALLTARTLLDNGGQLTAEAVVRAWQTYILDQGGVFERGGKPQYGAVANLRRGMLPPLSGRDNVGYDDDGAAMRIAPVGIVCAGEPERAAAMAVFDAQISHHADGIWAAQAMAASVAVAMVGGSTGEIISAGLDQIPADSWLGRAMNRAMRICDEAGNIETAWEALHDDLWTPSHSACAEAIPQVYAIFRLTDGDFHQGMFWGGNFGRDADTIGALIGAFAGAKHGITTIPPAWVEQVKRPRGVCLKFAAQEDITVVAQALAELIV
ncbi:MAG: ADP-ribosylglycohydrolase family protein [Chloroflexota bacterium]|nr:ADP-ribosylglycohydrolase family protein [Chloroflexota bacterium]